MQCQKQNNLLLRMANYTFLGKQSALNEPSTKQSNGSKIDLNCGEKQN